MAADEIERFRREIIERTGDPQQAENLTDQDLLREVMNTVGKHGRLGESIRCVVSVSMLTEGWDANTVTHVLGVRAFGTQLLCEQVDRPRAAPPVLRPERGGPVQRRVRRRPRHPVRLHGEAGGRAAAAAARDDPGQGGAARARRTSRSASRASRATASSCRRSGSTASSTTTRSLELTPDLVGADDDPERGDHRRAASTSPSSTPATCGRPRSSIELTIAPALTRSGATPDGDPQLHLFGQLKRITREWLDDYLVCKGGTYPGAAQVQDARRHGLRAHHGGDHPRLRRRAADQGGARPVQPDRLDDARQLHHVEDDRWETDAAPLPRQLGRSSTATGRPSSAASSRRIRACAPTSRTTTSGSRCPTATARRAARTSRTSSCSSTTGTATTTCCTWSSRSRATGARTRRRRSRRWRRTGCPRVNHSATYGRWAFAEFTDVYEIESGFEANGRERVRPDD